MIQKNARLVTAEAVRRGHPDKFCDQVADAILDAHLSYDPNARVAVEVMATAGKITIGGEITSRASINYEQVVAGVMHQIGYRWHDLCEDERDELDIQISVHEQSTDIAAAVDGRFPDSTLGAGDQGIMYGYATDETMARIPRAFLIAQKICMLLDEEAAHTPWLGVDGKAQVSLKYEGDRVFVHTIVVSVQHAPNAPEDRLRNLVTLLVYKAVGRQLKAAGESLGQVRAGRSRGGHRHDRSEAGRGSIWPHRAHRRWSAVREGRYQSGPVRSLRGTVDRQEPRRREAVQGVRGAACVRHRDRLSHWPDGEHLRHRREARRRIGEAGLARV